MAYGRFDDDETEMLEWTSHSLAARGELRAVDQALADERAPTEVLCSDGGYTPLTRMGRIRAVADRARVAERRADRLEREIKRLRAEFKAPKRASGPTVLPGQLDVDECIAEVERDAK